MNQPFGTVTIAPDVLSAIVSLTAQDVAGVARLGSVPGQQRMGSMLGSGSANADGVAIRVVDDSVSADCYLIAQPDINLLDLGARVQSAVTEALNEMVGMPVRAVNVYIQDVEQNRG
ncbi:Asp23/Gls24 family envelope stress response protein [Herpetosiphon giganteus]|uniref:Asp23/Gls24 family envelope stress response protein n=1 Tax=Herpetosiphon giganteus TaxID=2029754 RepID=UPI00195D10D0|nr:putative alkaline shock family protein YloU [Herpetosiphon giganteus]